MDYQYIRGEELPDCDKKYTRNLLRAYIDAHSKIFIGECPLDGAQNVSILQSQCANMTFAYQSRYIRMFQQVVHKVGESETNYIKIFQDSKALIISVGNSYTEDQLMHTFLDNFQQGRKYSAQIESHQA